LCEKNADTEKIYYNALCNHSAHYIQMYINFLSNDNVMNLIFQYYISKIETEDRESKIANENFKYKK